MACGRKKRQTGPLVEALEARQHLTVTGVVYADSDNNQQPNDADTFFPGVIVYVDENSNDVLDTGEANTFTQADGHYELETWAPVSLLKIFAPTGFASNDLVIPLVGDVRNFRLGPAPTIRGTLYDDHTFYGFRYGPALANVALFVDF